MLFEFISILSCEGSPALTSSFFFSNLDVSQSFHYFSFSFIASTKLYSEGLHPFILLFFVGIFATVLISILSRFLSPFVIIIQNARIQILLNTVTIIVWSDTTLACHCGRLYPLRFFHLHHRLTSYSNHDYLVCSALWHLQRYRLDSPWCNYCGDSIIGGVKLGLFDFTRLFKQLRGEYLSEKKRASNFLQDWCRNFFSSARIHAVVERSS